MLFDIGSWVWLPDEQDFIVPGEVISYVPNKTGKFRLQNGNERKLQGNELDSLQQLDPQCLDRSISNLIGLSNLSENALLHNLRIRFANDDIYTFVSSILIAVNPFRQLPLYGVEILERYKSTPDKSILPPHIFSIADNAYKSMINDGTSQSVVISGESGAGKTESTKLILQYLAELNITGSAYGSENNSSIQQQILQCNPVMEAFGNAKTVRNNNSSRFGKLITIRYEYGIIRGASIISYLLEKSRVVHQQDGERNYHFFYQIVAAAADNTELAKSLYFTDLDEHYYISQSSINVIEGLSDLEQYNEVQSAMEVLGMSTEQQMEVIKTVAGILHLGNIKFISTDTSGDSAAIIENDSILPYITNLLGFEEAETRRCLTSKNIGSRSIITCPYTPIQANDARDALSKKLYACLFDWLINTINISLKGQIRPNQIFIAVLDIFGFEAFQHNSFEQLCINYCNEKLQYHFNNHIFMMEQQEYAREGVPVEEIKFEDNQPTLDLLELKVTGIFSMIDEEINIPKGSDESLLSKIFQKHNSHHALQRPKSKIHKNVHECFVVVHYAGEVAYNVSGFLEKNKDSLSPDLESLGRNSSIQFISDFFTTREDSMSVTEMVRPKSVNLKTPRKVKTLGSQFKIQLATLMDTLNTTQPHFVRCMKPNMEKIGRKYDSFVMLYQLRYAGFLEVCRIRQMGYPNRLSFEKFMKLYQILAPQSRNPNELLNELLQTKKLKQGQCIIGTSKIFLKHSINNQLDSLRDQIYFSHAAKIQKYVRGIVQRARFRSYKKTLTNLKIAIKEKNLILLEDSIASSVELPNEGINMPLVKEAKNILKRLKEENKMNKLLEDAINERQILALESTIKTAKNMNPPLQSLILTKAIKLLERVKEEKILLNEATNLIKLKDLNLLENWLERAESLDLKSNELYKSIQIIVDRLHDEKNILEEIQLAIDTENLQILTAYLIKAMEMGLENNITIIQAKKYQLKFENQITGNKFLEVALETPHIESLQTAIKKATTSGVESNSQLMIKAKRVYDLLNQIQNIESLLKLSIDKSNIDDVRKELIKAEALQIVIRDDPILSKHNIEINGLDIANTFLNTRTQGNNNNNSNIQIHQEELILKIQNAIKLNDSNYLRSLIAEAKGLGLGKGEYSNLIQEADHIIQKNRIGMEMDMILIAAMKMKDLDSLNQAILNVQSHQLTIPPPSLNSAIKMRDDLMKQTNLIEQIQMAMESKNIDLIFQVVEEAKTLNLKNRIIDDGKHILERELIKSQLEKELLETTNQQVLSSVLDKSIQFGITSSVVDTARERYEQIKVNTTILEDIKFAIKNIEVLRSTEDGIKEDDLNSLKELLQSLELDDKLQTEEMKNIKKDALQALKRATKQIELQSKLLEITETTSFTQVKKLIRLSADLGLKNFQGFISASSILKILESSNNGRDEIIDDDFEGFNRMKEELYNEARQPNYHFSNYINLRTAEDFAKGTLLNKRKIMEGFLKHQKSSINRSLMKLDNIANSEALIAFKSLLGYCGDKAVSFPASQGLDFVNLGITKFHLRNELYLQAIKQTINAPSPYTQCRAFHILCLLSDAFLPSPDFYLYVVNYLLSHTDQVQSGIDPSSVQQMASYCLIRMQSLKLLPLENQLISIPVETVESYSARLPTIAPIYTPDNILLGELLVAPDVGVERLLSIICTLLHINECRKGLLGLYVVTTKSSDLAPMILLPDHDFYIGDICQAPLLQKFGRPIKYYVKRKILDPSSFEKFSLAFEANEKETKIEKEGLIDLTYTQFSSRIISDDIHILDESIVAHLAAINLAIDAQFRPGIPALALGQGCMKYIPESHQELQTDDYWGELVSQALYQCVNKSDNILKLEYIKIISNLPFGLMHTYICLKGSATTINNITTKIPEEIYLGINEIGLHFYNGTNDSNIPILSIKYIELKSYSVRLNSIRFILDGIMDNGVKLAYQIELITPLNEEISQYCILYRPVQVLEAQYNRKPIQSPAEQNNASQSRLDKLSQLRK